MLTLTTRDIWPNPERKLQLRNGRAVRIYSLSHESGDNRTIAGAYKTESGSYWFLNTWFSDGLYCDGHESSWDIIEAKPAMVRWEIETEADETLSCVAHKASSSRIVQAKRIDEK